MAAEPTAGLLTMGVEEEFLLVDVDTGLTTPCAPAVLRRMAGWAQPAGGTHAKAEMLTTQVEMATGVCTTLDQIADQLATGRRRLADACRDERAVPVSCGVPVLAGESPPVTEDERFQRILATYGDVVADYQVCGCHVHVGVPDREAAVAVVNHLRPWLPTLLALSANSPILRGRDTGYASWRVLEQARFPGSGLPPYLPSAGAYGKELDRLVACGAIVDTRMTFWLARPSPQFPTVELRVADAAATVEDAVLQAALSRALVRRALDDLSAGRTAPELRDQVGAAAVWSAARHGLGGPGVEPRQEKAVPCVSLVDALLDHVATPLAEAGDLQRVRAHIDRLLADGGPARRQRDAARNGPRAVVDLLARQTAPSFRARLHPSPGDIVF